MNTRVCADTCRWCREPCNVRHGRLVGLDGATTCNANTAGCGRLCGFACTCQGSGWAHGQHEPMIRPEVAFVAARNLWGLTYVVTDGVRAIEWTLNGDRPIQIDHAPAPDSPDDEPLPCGLVVTGRCYADSRRLWGAARAAFESGDVTVIERAMRARWAHGAR